nr:MAG TPA: hypothetical protein [Caudoviricetes sp.]
MTFLRSRDGSRFPFVFIFMIVLWNYTRRQ